MGAPVQIVIGIGIAIIIIDADPRGAKSYGEKLPASPLLPPPSTWWMPTSKTCETPPLLIPFLELGVATAYSRLEAQGGPTDAEIDEARAWGERLPEVADLLIRSAPGEGRSPLLRGLRRRLPVEAPTRPREVVEAALDLCGATSA